MGPAIHWHLTRPSSQQAPAAHSSPASLGTVRTLIHGLGWGSAGDKPHSSRCPSPPIAGLQSWATKTELELIHSFSANPKSKDTLTYPEKVAIFFKFTSKLMWEKTKLFFLFDSKRKKKMKQKVTMKNAMCMYTLYRILIRIKYTMNWTSRGKSNSPGFYNFCVLHVLCSFSASCSAPLLYLSISWDTQGRTRGQERNARTALLRNGKIRDY